MAVSPNTVTFISSYSALTYLVAFAFASGSGKRAVLYTRVSTGDQHPETQLYDLRELAKQRRYEIVREYTDTISGAKSKRPGLDQLLADGRRHRFDVVLVAAFDRVARNVRHFLEVLDELSHLNIEFVSLRENIDTGGPLGRAMFRWLSSSSTSKKWRTFLATLSNAATRTTSKRCLRASARSWSRPGSLDLAPEIVPVSS